MAYIPKNVYRPNKTSSKNWLKNQDDAKFYNTRTWRKFSLLYKRNNPTCEMEGCTQPSYYTDHKIPISSGGDKWELSNLQALCKSCNGRKTAKQK